jgi:hypothetical protein
MRVFDTLIEDMAPGTLCLLGDARYDVDQARQELLLYGILPVIPASPCRTKPAPLHRKLCRLRNQVERPDNRLKQL